MGGRTINVCGRAVWVEEIGHGEPLLYLHGIADLHGARATPLEFLNALARSHTIIAPAHPGCAESDENDDIEGIEDIVFHTLEDAHNLGLETFHLVGTSVGGWIAAEFAVRHRERIRSLTLIGATGLYIPNQPIADIFMAVQSTDGGCYADFREMLFADADQKVALEMFPDGLGQLNHELLRYKTFRFLSRVGFRPPYLYNRLLRQRLHRYENSALIICGENDNMVPLSHAKAYHDGLHSAHLEVLPNLGHSAIIEAPLDIAERITAFINTI